MRATNGSNCPGGSGGGGAWAKAGAAAIPARTASVTGTFLILRICISSKLFMTELGPGGLSFWPICVVSLHNLRKRIWRYDKAGGTHTHLRRAGAGGAGGAGHAGREATHPAGAPAGRHRHSRQERRVLFPHRDIAAAERAADAGDVAVRAALEREPDAPDSSEIFADRAYPSGAAGAACGPRGDAGRKRWSAYYSPYSLPAR